MNTEQLSIEKIQEFIEMKKSYGKLIRTIQKKTYDKEYYEKHKDELNARTKEKLKSRYANDEEYREKRRAYQREYALRKKNQ
jgi:L-ribulose-5-phosphate 3-epimerase UlaE